ncbi:unnamed protein product [Knipowitschia caucasica]
MGVPLRPMPQPDQHAKAAHSAKRKEKKRSVTAGGLVLFYHDSSLVSLHLRLNAHRTQARPRQGEDRRKDTLKTTELLATWGTNSVHAA